MAQQTVEQVYVPQEEQVPQTIEPLSGPQEEQGDRPMTELDKYNDLLRQIQANKINGIKYDSSLKKRLDVVEMAGVTGFLQCLLESNGFTCHGYLSKKAQLQGQNPIRYLIESISFDDINVDYFSVGMSGCQALYADSKSNYYTARSYATVYAMSSIIVHFNLGTFDMVDSLRLAKVNGKYSKPNIRGITINGFYYPYEHMIAIGLNYIQPCLETLPKK